jgi:hypothetical protein
VAFSLALVKRMREVVFGCFALVSWQGAEIFRTRRYLRRAAAFVQADDTAAHDTVRSEQHEEVR